ncbi:MAG TPA: ATP-binding protein, partial [Pyrinomonadaceae bacterium]|nr:ATP-binding protein [Pyrinomonadaceae bacterium]
ESVRRIMRADTASVASFSLAEGTITWESMSGSTGRGGAEGGGVVAPLVGRAAVAAATADELVILEGVGTKLSADEFPLHGAGGIQTIAFAPLAARGERLGALVVGYRAARTLSADERATLEGLAGMAALALDNARLVETVGTAKKVWEQTFDAIPDGIIVHDAQMIVARANLSAAEMLGLDSPAEAVGLTCAAAFARLFGERAAAYHMARDTSTASSFEIQAEDGRRHLVSVAPLGELEQGWSVIVWGDVTQLSEMQEQLSRTRRLATVGQLAAGVAHEINNPLAAITTCAEATRRDLRSVPEFERAAEERGWNFYLEEIVRQALRCKQITRGLLDLARQRRALREPCDLNALAAHTVRLFEQRAAASDAKGVAFELRLDDSLGEVATDENLVRQVLDNLLTNALDALGAGGRVTVSTAAAGERVRLEVADTGPGIPAERLARIFEPFYTTKEAGRGSGLGLAIAATLAEALNGSLTAESKVGAGSCFRLWLPRLSPGRAED